MTPAKPPAAPPSAAGPQRRPFRLPSSRNLCSPNPLGPRHTDSSLAARRRRTTTTRLSSQPSGPPSHSLEGRIVRVMAFLTNLFPLWVLAAAALGLSRPSALAWLSPERITAALASTMLFMGMTLEVEDFKRVMKNPQQVFLGFMCQFTIMPLLGYSM
eukprot:CAMPEP_0114114720 /NCGR_PEP_ID=MMETSP0043_2-20121206/3581_1 /TAXON_ID=464988 /ORGANISM="Hemiselmis andersenii, Strain CCMP644" /LENGTH=157 /DNA_ID=CAMNT_0001206925 /DNA_START=96 /DNA_END=566 /DNA_ORIENTATION=-